MWLLKPPLLSYIMSLNKREQEDEIYSLKYIYPYELEGKWNNNYDTYDSSNEKEILE